MNEYQRNGSAESSTWRTDTDRFQGYTRAKLEDLEEMQKEQWKAINNSNKRVKWLETKAQMAIGGLALLNAIILIITVARQLGFF